MSWTRLDDRWTERSVFTGLSYEARWHYLALIQFCSRTDRVDGPLTVKNARRCSDVEDSAAALSELVGAGLLASEAAQFRLVEIDDHVPPPSVRENAAKTKIRMRRKRAHKVGDHSLCLPDHCADAPNAPVTGLVTRNAGTGRDGTGQDSAKGGSSSRERIDFVTGEVVSLVAAIDCSSCGVPLTTAVRRERGVCNRCWVVQKAAAS